MTRGFSCPTTRASAVRTRCGSSPSSSSGLGRYDSRYSALPHGSREVLVDELTAEDLRRHYDDAETSPDLERAELDTNVVTEPMVGITIRLSAATLDAARSLASEQGVRVTALLREWIEERVAEHADDTRVVPVATSCSASFFGRMTLTPSITNDPPISGQLASTKQSTPRTGTSATPASARTARTTSTCLCTPSTSLV